jgi:hypothetical protein
MFNIGDIVTTNGKTVKGRKVIGFIADIQPDASHKYKVIPLNNSTAPVCYFKETHIIKVSE